MTPRHQGKRPVLPEYILFYLHEKFYFIFLCFLRFREIPNSVFKVKSERRKVFVGDQIDECKDYSGLFYVLPFQKVMVDNFVIVIDDIKRRAEAGLR